MESHAQLADMNAHQLRELAASLIDRVQQLDHDNRSKQLRIDQLIHEMAIIKNWRFGRRSELLHGEQKLLFDETIEADLEAIALELKALNHRQGKEPPKGQPKRAALPAELPRVEVRHEPDSTTCGCGCQLKRIGEDISEKLDYTPGVFTVERHIRGKWACANCLTLMQAPVPAHVIDKGIPTAGLLSQVLVAKYADHRVPRARPP